MAITVPKEYKHMTRKEVAAKHPEVINAMKAAVLDRLIKINAVPGFEYMFEDVLTDTDNDWAYKYMHLFSKEEIEKNEAREKRKETEELEQYREEFEKQKRQKLENLEKALIRLSYPDLHFD
jgi:hypothetical protein